MNETERYVVRSFTVGSHRRGFGQEFYILDTVTNNQYNAGMQSRSIAESLARQKNVAEGIDRAMSARLDR